MLSVVPALFALVTFVPTNGSEPTGEMTALVVDSRDGRCSARLEDRDYRIPEDSDGIESHLTDLKARNFGVIVEIVTQPDREFVPWRCVGGLIFHAQRLGIRVDFASEPPTDSTHNW